MDRQLKFRVWYNNKMTYTPLVSMSIFHFVNMKNQKKELNGVIMQFTGIKDKNEKEIYESDIINIHITEGIVETMKAEVRFNEHSYCWYENNKHMPWCTNEIEVIGNIHENPKLLTNN